MILCASGLRSVSGVGETQAVVRLAADAGFEGLAIGAECPVGHVTALGAAALAAGLAVPVMAAPLAEGPLEGGRRLPHLAAFEDTDERRAAIALFRSLLEMAVPLGIRHLTVYMGGVTLAAQATEIAYRFARRELLDEDDAGAPLWEAAVDERRALSGQVMDGCRYALDRILPEAEKRDVTLSIEVAGGPWSAPTPREALQLLREYTSAPVGVAWDAGKMQVLANLGIAPAAERLAALATRATIWRANQAVGIYSGYLPGLGDPPAGLPTFPVAAEKDGQAALAVLPAGISTIVSGHPDSSASELAAARQQAAEAIAAIAAASKAAQERSALDRSDLDRLGTEQRR